MKKIILTGLLGIASLSIFSQAKNSQYDMYSRTIDLNVKARAFGLTEAQFDAIKDEAYANPTFIPGTIYQEDHAIKTGVPMRYNAYADEIEIKKDAASENYSALVKDPEIFVKMGLGIYLFVPYEGSVEKGGYFNVLTDGKTYDLYKKTTALYTEPKQAKTNYDRASPPSFTKIVTYYLVQNGTFLEMPKGKNKILKMMDKNKNEIRSYIKENHLDIDKEADLVKLISYFDSLQ